MASEELIEARRDVAELSGQVDAAKASLAADVQSVNEEVELARLRAERIRLQEELATAQVAVAAQAEATQQALAQFEPPPDTADTDVPMGTVAAEDQTVWHPVLGTTTAAEVNKLTGADAETTPATPTPRPTTSPAPTPAATEPASTAREEL